MLHTYHRSISLEFFKQCCDHSLTCFGSHKNKCCYIHNNVTNINKVSIGAFLWKSTRQILVISITTSQTCPGGCYIHNNITNSNKTKSCYIHTNVTNLSRGCYIHNHVTNLSRKNIDTPCIQKKYRQLDAALSKNIDNLQMTHFFGHSMYSKKIDKLMQHYLKILKIKFLWKKK